jgi:hypothetical protein
MTERDKGAGNARAGHFIVRLHAFAPYPSYFENPSSSASKFELTIMRSLNGLPTLGLLSRLLELNQNQHIIHDTQ